MTTTVFLDESGYTGDDLLDAPQPTFVVATHVFSADECAALATEHFGELNVGELKHAMLQRNAFRQRAVLGLMRAAAQQPEKVRVSIAHKRFALTLKLIDWMIEPRLHRQGFDIYRDGFFRSFGNVIFHTPQAENSRTLDEVLSAFQALVRRRTAPYLNEFLRVVNRPALLGVIDEVLDMLRVHVNQVSLGEIAQLPPRALDISATMALQCVYAWRNAEIGEMEILHDRSGNMARSKHLWDAIVAPTAPEAVVGYGDRSIQFPLGVSKTAFVDSADHLGVQLSDVISGATARWARWILAGGSKTDAYGCALNEVFASIAQPFFASAMWPCFDVNREDTADGLTSPLDYLVARTAEARDPVTSLERYEEHGAAGLMERSRRPHGWTVPTGLPNNGLQQTPPSHSLGRRS